MFNAIQQKLSTVASFKLKCYIFDQKKVEDLCDIKSKLGCSEVTKA